jgi:glycosyltransferase involved in cell wall biosynthesis
MSLSIPAKASVPISVVVIAKNEEENIADCLASAAFADDIVVVDDSSVDKTVEIARRYTSHILERKMDIEGRHRNWAYEQAQNEWVFSLDADERITPELANELAVLVAGAPKACVYHVPIKNYLGSYWVKYGGWYPGRKDRFFKKGCFKYEEAEVHPRVFVQGARGKLNGDILHYSYRGFADFVNSVNAQTTLEARKWNRDGRRVGFGKAMWRGTDRFFRAYIAKKGYKDGFIGFVVALFAGAYQLLSYAKYWELKNLKSKP